MIYSLLLSIVLMVALHGMLAAQPPTPADSVDTIPTASRSGTRWFVPYLGGYFRSPFGFALEVGARGGIEIVHNIVGITAEVGFVAAMPTDDGNSSPVLGAHAIRLEMTPLPFGFMKRVLFHVDKRFFGGVLAPSSGLGYGFAVRSETPEPKEFAPFFDCTFVTGGNAEFPIPFFGFGMLMTF